MILDLTEETLKILSPEKKLLTIVNIGTEQKPAPEEVIQGVADYYKQHKDVPKQWDVKKEICPKMYTQYDEDGYEQGFYVPDEKPEYKTVASYPVEVSTTFIGPGPGVFILTIGTDERLPKFEDRDWTYRCLSKLSREQAVIFFAHHALKSEWISKRDLNDYQWEKYSGHAHIVNPKERREMEL